MTEKTTIEINDYYSFNFIKNMDVTNNGEHIAYVVANYHDIDKKEDKVNENNFHKEEKSNIFLYSVFDGTTKQLTFGKHNINPSFSPDGKTIAFVSKRSEENQIYILFIQGGEAKQLTSNETGVSSVPIWSPDGKKIAFSASKLAKKPDLKRPYRYKRDFYRLDALGNVDNFNEDIFVIDTNTRKMSQITDDDCNHINPKWSPNGKKLMFFTSLTTKGIDSFFPFISIHNNDKITDHLTEFATNVIEWIDDNSIVFQGSKKNQRIGKKENIFKYDLSTRKMEVRSDNCELGIGGRILGFMPTLEGRLPKLFVSTDKNTVFTDVQVKGAMSIFSFTLNGDKRYHKILGGERSNYIQKITEKYLFFSSSNFHNPHDIFVSSLDGSNEKQLTFSNKKIMENKLLPEIRCFKFKSSDGEQVEGWMLIPKGKLPHPTLLKIHGGPHAGYGYIFQWDALLFSGSGYAVFMINHRGSTGYGDDFATKILGDWGNQDYNDLMAGIDYVIDQGISDSNKLGCFGISGGGNLSCLIVGKTNRFKASIPENPLTNWVSFYGVSDIGRWFAINELGGLPHEIPDIYTKCSPITYAHNCKTPTLLIQHDNDLRCPPEQSEQLYAVLKDSNCVVEMLRMPETSHDGSNIGPLEIRHSRSEAILEWFNNHI